MAGDTSPETILQTVNANWNATFNSGDSAKLATLYTENPTLSPGNGEILLGQDKIGELFKSFIDNGVHNHTIETVEAYRDNGQIVQLGKWRAEGVNDKQEAISFGGVLMTVIQQNAEGAWLTQSHV